MQPSQHVRYDWATSVAQAEDSRDGPGRVACFNHVDDAKDKLRKLMDSWNDSLSVKKLSFAEEYIKGRLSVVCYVSLGTKSDKVNASPVANSDRTHEDRVAVSVFSSNVGKLRNRYNWDQKSVFVEIVKFAESPDGEIPGLVRLYIVNDNIRGVRRGLLYRSLIDGIYKIVPSFVHGECGPTVVYPGVTNYCSNDMIQRGSEVVNGIADDERNLVRQPPDGSEPENVLSGLRLYIDAETIEVGFQEGGQAGLKLMDVAYGPFDLQP
jgi:hypothetical protein